MEALVDVATEFLTASSSVCRAEVRIHFKSRTASSCTQNLKTFQSSFGHSLALGFLMMLCLSGEGVDLMYYLVPVSLC